MLEKEKLLIKKKKTLIICGYLIIYIIIILGVALNNGKANQTKIILNPNYIGVQDEKKQRKITDSLLQEYPKRIIGKLLPMVIDESNVNKLYKEVSASIDYYQQKGKKTYYYDGLKRFLERNYNLEEKKK